MSCFFNLLDESCAGEIWELLASSSQSWNVCRFVGVNGSPSSGSWSAVTDTDCWIKQIAMNKLNAKLKAMKCQNARVATKIILKNESNDQNLWHPRTLLRLWPRFLKVRNYLINTFYWSIINIKNQLPSLLSFYLVVS